MSVAVPQAAGGASQSQLQKAYFQLHDPPADGSTSGPAGERGRIDFQFNPKELSFTKAGNWSRESSQNAASASAPEYRGPAPSSMSIEAFFDATERMDTSAAEAVARLVACTAPDAQASGREHASPPWVVFHWGQFSGFTSYVKQVQVTYSLFRPDGVPVRAAATVALEEITGPPRGTNPTSGALAPTREHVVREGDTLPVIAFREYGTTAAWRAVAAANQVDDPVRLRPGTRLLLPAPSELRRTGPRPPEARR